MYGCHVLGRHCLFGGHQSLQGGQCDQQQMHNLQEVSLGSEQWQICKATHNMHGSSVLLIELAV